MADPASVQVGPTIYGAGYSKIPRVTDELTSGRIRHRLCAGQRLALRRASFGVNYADREKDKDQPEGGINTLNGAYFQIDGEHLLAPTNLGYANAGSDARVGRAGVLRHVLSTDRLWHADDAGLRLPDRQELDRERESRHGVREGQSRSRALLQRDSARQHRPAVRRHGPELGRVREGQHAARGPAGRALHATARPIRTGCPRSISRSCCPAIRPFASGSRESWLVPAWISSRRRASSPCRSIGEPSGSGGNPQLDPWRANAFDLSYEKYFGTNAYVSVAGVLQGPEELHLQSDQRQLRLLGVHRDAAAELLAARRDVRRRPATSRSPSTARAAT